MSKQELINETKHTVINQLDYLINAEGLDIEDAINELIMTEIRFEGIESQPLGNDEFMDICKKLVVEYTNKKLEVTDQVQISGEDVYVVWLTKALQNNKALFSTNLFDGMYYEITYNGEKQELYLDAYKKFENRKIQLK